MKIYLCILSETIKKIVYTLKECIQRGYVIRRFPKEDTVHLFAAVETKMGKTVPVGYYAEVAGTHETEVSLKLKNFIMFMEI